MKYINLAFLLLSMSLFTGCDDDTERFTLPDSGDALSVNYRVEGEMALSRGVVATEHEKTLDYVHVLYFDNETDAYSGFSSSPVVAGKTTFSVEPPETLTADKPYKVLAVGNGDKYADGAYESLNAKLESMRGNLGDIKEKLLAYYNGNVTAKSVDALPLFGTFVNKDNGEESTFTVTKEDGVLKVTESGSAEFIFSRAICRIDIHNLVGDKLKIKYARVANNRTSGHYFADGLNAGEVAEMNTSITDPSGSDLYMPVTSDITESTNTQRMEASLYTFPNIVAHTVQNDKVTTCLIIAGYYVDPDKGEDTDLTFYRFNLANVGESQTLQRNYAYRATIKGVKRRGADNEKDAYNDAIPIFEYDVDDEWDATDDNFVSDEDGNFLIVNKTHFTFNGEATEADFVELRVSTNPQLTWRVEEVNRENQENNKFILEKLSDSAVKCGPREPNNTDYVRYGYYKIVATSSTIKKDLEIYIYLVQLSTKDNVKMLSVNGNTGEFTQEVSPDGDNISLKVLTGSKYNDWVANDGGVIATWGKDAFITKEGTHNGYLTINVPANIGENERTSKIVVNLAKEDENVKPVTIHVVQKPTTRWFAISPDPGDGIYLDASSLEPGHPNGVCSGSSRGFTVTLKNKDYKYRITTTFDILRDLRITANNHLEDDPTGVSIPIVISGSNAIASKDVVATDANKEKYTNPIKELESGTKFYLNPFRMGPGDPAIEGTVTVEAFDPSNPNAITPNAAKLTFNVTIKGFDSYSLNDVIIGDLLVADRNIGHSSRVRKNADGTPMGGSEGRIDALNYHYTSQSRAESLYCNTYLYIQRGKGNEVFEMNEEWNDRNVKIFNHDECGSQYQSNWTNYINSLYTYWYKEHNDAEMLYSPFYTGESKWELPINTDWQEVLGKAIFSKWRVFLVSDVPTKTKYGKEVPTVCWLHQTRGEMTSSYGPVAYTPYLALQSQPDEIIFANTFCATLMQNEYETSFITNLTIMPKQTSVRLVHKLEGYELESYKKNYLGY